MGRTNYSLVACKRIGIVIACERGGGSHVHFVPFRKIKNQIISIYERELIKISRKLNQNQNIYQKQIEYLYHHIYN